MVEIELIPVSISIVLNIVFIFYLDWIENPVLISVETTDYPVEKIPFPTVTVCQKDNDPNKMQFIEKILNHVRYPCYDDHELVLLLFFSHVSFL